MNSATTCSRINPISMIDILFFRGDGSRQFDPYTILQALYELLFGNQKGKCRCDVTPVNPRGILKGISLFDRVEKMDSSFAA